MKNGFVIGLIAVVSSLSVFSFKTFDAERKTSLISYYSDKFNGKRTASGEIFDNAQLTAANRLLPFGTRLQLTNLKNGKSCIVRINDRGPFHSSRALDVSKAAFRAIGNPAAGTMTVEYKVVD